MSTLHRSPLIAFLSGFLVVVSACSDRPLISRLKSDAQVVPASQPQVSQAQTAATPPAKSPTLSPGRATQPDAYDLGLARASSALNISQSAQSKDDWHLVAERWQQAIQLMSSLPKSHRNYAKAALKLIDYRRSLALAQQQGDRPTTHLGNPSRVVVRTSEPSRPSLIPRAIASSKAPKAAIAVPPSRGVGVTEGTIRPAASTTSFLAPIVRRAGNTPVIAVTFNGSQTYEMIVDTGASGTLITAEMATSLGIRPVGETIVDTASAQGVSFSLGYVDSIEVGGAVAQNVLVAMGSSELTLGLLGHDFFGNYDIIIRQNEVEFRER